jgi:hypothetical protein
MHYPHPLQKPQHFTLNHELRMTPQIAAKSPFRLLRTCSCGGRLDAKQHSQLERFTENHRGYKEQPVRYRERGSLEWSVKPAMVLHVVKDAKCRPV